MERPNGWGLARPLLAIAPVALLGIADVNPSVHGPIPIVVDDTLAPKKGEHIDGIGSHRDAVRSTKSHCILCFGHVWVVLAVAIRVPFCRRPWALPVLLRLYRTSSSCDRKGRPFKKKTELAREMLEVFAGWVDGRRVELVADAAYCNSTVTGGLPKNIVLFGAMRPDAALTALPAQQGQKRGGRPRVRGQQLSTPEEVYKGPVRCSELWITNMALTQEAVDKLKLIHEAETGEKLSDEDVWEMATRLLEFASLAIGEDDFDD